ncbi:MULTISPECIES: hypothetical protein [Streptomyces]|uniref:PknH-like extracellular domain-containing protein n=1 Tax=Streptomyces nymphaeiformis TaxID=2663842 RepID=A0A7W7U3Y3_9ACTN|nr:hypothetical protein [Streptomyces nymphaeiformis]MBB4983712.1 hypothetical protein [Streptomyces nymphaeiformis]
MRDAYGRLLRAAAVAAGGLLLAGCSSGGGGDEAKPSRATPTASASGAPTASPTPAGPVYVLDPKKAPRTQADAKRLALAVVAGPDDWGPGYVKRSPYLSDPGSWPVLDASCEWEAGTLPRSVLYSVTAYSEIPATGGKGPLRVAATVTVHRTEPDADWEMAETLEEALRCPDQQLRQGERITGLNSLGMPYGVGGNQTTTDSLIERGEYHNDAIKGQQYYTWFQTRVGQVTFASVVKGASGYAEGDTNAVQARVNVFMQDRVKEQLGAQS